MDELNEVLERIRTLSEKYGFTEEKVNDLVVVDAPPKPVHTHNQSSCSACKGALKGDTQHYALGRLLHPTREH